MVESAIKCIDIAIRQLEDAIDEERAQYAVLANEAVAREREACAQLVKEGAEFLCDEYGCQVDVLELVAAIRARGEAGRAQPIQMPHAQAPGTMTFTVDEAGKMPLCGEEHGPFRCGRPKGHAGAHVEYREYRDFDGGVGGEFEPKL